MATMDYAFDGDSIIGQMGIQSTTRIIRDTAWTVTGVSAKKSAGQGSGRIGLTAGAKARSIFGKDILYSLDANSPGTLNTGSPANNDTITTWRNGETQTAVVGSSASGPNYNTTMMNSLPGCEFAASEYIPLGSALTFTNSADWSIFAVLKTITQSSNNCPIIANYDTSNTTGDKAFWGIKNNKRCVYDDNGNKEDATSDLPASGEIRMITCDGSANRVREYVDGTQLFNVTGFDGGFTFNRMSQGADNRNTFNGIMDIPELLAVSQYLGGNNSTRVSIEGYLAHKWWGSGQANPLANGHTYKSTDPRGSGYDDLAGSGGSYALTGTLTDSGLANTTTNKISVSAGQAFQIVMTKSYQPGTVSGVITYTVP